MLDPCGPPFKEDHGRFTTSLQDGAGRGHTILEPLGTLLSDGRQGHRKIRSRDVDWNQTADNIVAGRPNPLAFRPRADSAGPAAAIATVFLEFREHVGVLRSHLDGTNGGAFVESEQLVANIHEVEEKLDETAARDGAAELLADGRGMIALSEIRSAFREVVNSPFDTVSTNLGNYCETWPELAPASDASDPRALLAKEWRQQYLTLATGLGFGSDLLVKGTTDLPRLFELWSFFEVLNSLDRSRGVTVQQTALITGERNHMLFHMPGMGDAFYNYGGAATAGNDSLRSKILRRTNVEWFVRLSDGQRMVFDSKLASWRSSHNLTVMGYLEDFDADIGVVVFPRSIPVDAYEPGVVNSERVTIIDQRDRGGKMFAAICLEPAERAERHNASAISRVLEHVVIGTLQQPQQ